MFSSRLGDGEFLQVRGCGEEANERGEGLPERFPSLYIATVSLV
jgi:hypothetical protein